MDFDDRGRYISLNAINFFSEAKDEGVKEQVTRVLLEWLIVHRPHPVSLICII